MLKYKDFLLIRPDEVQKKQISKVIEENNGSVFHEISLNEIVASQFNTNLFYLVDDPNDISVLSPVHKEHVGSVLERYHFKPLFDVPYAGFIGKNFLFNSDNFSIGNFDSLVYVGFPVNPTFNGNSDKIRIGQTCMVDLSFDEHTIFNSTIQSKRRNMIRKAVKSGVTIKKYTTIEGLTKFWPILLQLHKKLGFDRLTFNYISGLLIFMVKENKL